MSIRNLNNINYTIRDLVEDDLNNKTNKNKNNINNDNNNNDNSNNNNDRNNYYEHDNYIEFLDWLQLKQRKILGDIQQENNQKHNTKQHNKAHQQHNNPHNTHHRPIPTRKDSLKMNFHKKIFYLQLSSIFSSIFKQGFIVDWDQIKHPSYGVEGGGEGEGLCGGMVECLSRVNK